MDAITYSTLNSTFFCMASLWETGTIQRGMCNRFHKEILVRKIRGIRVSYTLTNIPIQDLTHSMSFKCDQVHSSPNALNIEQLSYYHQGLYCLGERFPYHAMNELSNETFWRMNFTGLFNTHFLECIHIEPWNVKHAGYFLGMPLIFQSLLLTFHFA